MAYQLISAFLLQPAVQHICSADTTTTSGSNGGANEMDFKKCPHTAPGSFCFSSKPLCLHLYAQQGLWSRFAISRGSLKGSADTYLHRWAAGKAIEDVADWTVQRCSCQPGIFFVIASTYAQFCYTNEHCFFRKKQCYAPCAAGKQSKWVKKNSRAYFRNTNRKETQLPPVLASKSCNYLPFTGEA